MFRVGNEIRVIKMDGWIKVGDRGIIIKISEGRYNIEIQRSDSHFTWWVRGEHIELAKPVKIDENNLLVGD